MKRIKLADRVLPDYTRGEEIFNMTSHIIGAVIGIVALTMCVIFAALHQNVYGVVGSAIFGATMIVLYTMSSIYHGLDPNRKAKRVFQVIDHCSIFLLIAGSYTPFCLCTLREQNAALGWSIFGVIWGAALVGMTLNAIDLKRYNVVSMILYIVMGWCIAFTGRYLTALGRGGFTFLLLGGLSYTVGAIFYGIGVKKRYRHSIFHLFVVLGSFLHMFCIMLYVV